MLIERPTKTAPPSIQAIEELAPSTPAAREKRQRLIQAASAVMSREGYAGTSMKDIAQEAEIAQGLIHYYFDSKEDLVMAVVKDHCAQMLTETLAAFDQASGGPLERIWPALEVTRQRTKERPEIWRVFMELLPVSLNNPSLRSQFRDLYAELIRGTTEIVEAINQQVPTPVPVEPEHFARVVAAAIDGIALQTLVDPGLDVDALYTALGFVLIATVSASFAAAGQPVPGLEALPPELCGPAGPGSPPASEEPGPGAS